MENGSKKKREWKKRGQENIQTHNEQTLKAAAQRIKMHTSIPIHNTNTHTHHSIPSNPYKSGKYCYNNNPTM